MSFPVTPLESPLDRKPIVRELRALLQWHRTLRAFPDKRTRIHATPFVSLFVHGELRGCYGNDDGLARAFLAATQDQRYGGVRDELATAQVSFVCDPRPIDDADDLEPGVDGVANEKTLILPYVARLRGLDGQGMIDALARKGGSGQLYAFTTEDIVVRMEDDEVDDPLDAAARWLARLVDGTGQVAFAVDATKRRIELSGEFHAGRAAVVVRALARHGGHARAVTRASEWLRQHVTTDPERALAILAGVNVELTPNVAELARSPWHAAQVVAALGGPDLLYRACVDDLAERPWAPWTAIAAYRLNDFDTFERIERTLRDSIDRNGGVRAPGGKLPETAMTAIVLEAIGDVPEARAFLRRMQIRSAPAWMDPRMATGAFMASPIHDVLRGDITAHALLALPKRLDERVEHRTHAARTRAPR